MSDDARHLLLPVLRYYLPQEITKSLQSTSTGFYIPGIRAKLYQRADGSADDVFNFYSFPGSATKFEMGMTVPYNMNTYVYTGMTHSDRTFAYKHDLLIYLEQVVSHIVRHNTLFMSLISFYLKSKERELGNGNFELALVDRDIFRQVCAKFEEAMGRLREKGEDMYSKKLPEISHEQFCGRMADFLKSRHDQDIKPLMDVFKDYEKPIASLVSQGVYGEYCVWIGTIVEILNEFIDSHPGMFKPSSISKPIDEPDIIRCFEDDRNFLIMDYEFELAKAQNRKVSDYEEKNIKEVKEKIKRTGVYGTVLCNKSTKKTDNVEYVKLPIVRIYRRAVPIPTFDGRHCILASDLLFEILRDMCSVLNVFQKVTQDNWSIVEDCFNNLAETFDEKLRPFFIDTEHSERVRKQCEDYFEKHLGSSQVNMISEVPETGFTVRDLKENVKYLGLENAFPNIMDFAEFSYSVVKTISGKMTLDTRDMFTALEICQLNCILPKLPKLERFVHNQGACGHVCYQCSKCPPFMPEDFFKPILRKWIRSRTSELSQSFFAPAKEDVEQTNDNLEAETGSSDEIKNSEFPTSSEDKENMPNPSEDEKCDNFEMFEEELQELIGYYVYEKERTCNKWGKNNRILDGSMKRFGPYELSEEIRELFNKQFDRIMTQSGWDIKNCQPDDDCRTWPWFTHKEHDNND